MRIEIKDVIQSAIRPLRIVGKEGRSKLQPTIAAALVEAGFEADKEDRKEFLASRMPVWRCKDNLAIKKTSKRRLIDIVVYKGQEVVGVIETEADLDDLREDGVSTRNGHYDVFSIARSSTGKFFDSYKSLERMAAAAYFHSAMVSSGHYPIPEKGSALLEELRTNDPIVHNPLGIPLFLVSGRCRAKDRPILIERLASLNAQLICWEEPG